MNRKLALMLAVVACMLLFASIRCNSNKDVQIITVKSEGFPVDVQKAFGLSFASETLANGNVYAGFLRNAQDSLCSTCDTDLDFQKTHAYVWVLARKPVRLCIVGDKATVMCSGKNNKMYYIFPINKKFLRGVNEIVVTPD